MSNDHDQDLEKKQQSLVTLVNAARVAQKRGAFTLEEAAVIHMAVKAFSEDTVSNTEETDKNL